jgi:hypothetical protein
MPELTLQETQAITELAKALYSFIPATAYPYSKPKVDFGTVARDVGIGNLWLGGSKLPAIQALLEKTLQTRRDKFCSLMIHIVKEGLKYRNNKGAPITQEEMNRLNQLIMGVGFKIPELHDAHFISSLPKAKSEKDERTSCKISPEKIESIKQRLLQIEKQEPQKGGYEFEKLLYDLFDLYGFSPRPSFRNTGEQIDGSIEFESHFYLIEAKWQTKPVLEKDLLVLHGRVSGHSSIGYGIFITSGSFSPDGLNAFQRLQPTSIIGFDGQDLYIILERHLSLADVIHHKVRKLAESGEFHYPVLKLIPEILNAKKK